MSDEEIRLADSQDLKEIMNLYRSCATKMNSQGLYNWSSDYPDNKIIQNDISSRELYVFSKPPICAAIVLTEKQPVEYDQIPWIYKGVKILVIRRLAVHPESRKSGIASSLTRFTESFARKKKYSSIHLDVYSKSEAAYNLYKKLHYKRIAEFYYKGFAEPFIAMEKSIIPATEYSNIIE